MTHVKAGRTFDDDDDDRNDEKIVDALSWLHRPRGIVSRKVFTRKGVLID